MLAALAVFGLAIELCKVVAFVNVQMYSGKILAIMLTALSLVASMGYFTTQTTTSDRASIDKKIERLEDVLATLPPTHITRRERIIDEIFALERDKKLLENGQNAIYISLAKLTGIEEARIALALSLLYSIALELGIYLCFARPAVHTPVTQTEGAVHTDVQSLSKVAQPYPSLADSGLSRRAWEKQRDMLLSAGKLIKKKNSYFYV